MLFMKFPCYSRSIYFFFRKYNTFYWLLAIGGILFTLLFPGDAPWINDDAKFIYTALIANQQGTLAEHPLIGTFGTPYGPLAIWFYQFVLLISKDLVMIVVIKSIITLLILFFPLYRLSKELSLSPYPILILFFSPYLFFYTRLIWDNCFLVPLSALLLFTVVKFTLSHSLRWFATMLIAIWLLLHIHLMPILILIPLVVFILLFECRWIKKEFKKVLICISIFIIEPSHEPPRIG